MRRVPAVTRTDRFKSTVFEHFTSQTIVLHIVAEEDLQLRIAAKQCPNQHAADAPDRKCAKQTGKRTKTVQCVWMQALTLVTFAFGRVARTVRPDPSAPKKTPEPTPFRR